MTDARPHRRVYTLRGLSLALAVAFSVLVVGNAAALAWMSGVTSRLAKDVEDDTKIIDTAHDLEQSLREHHRVMTLAVVARDPELAVVSDDLASALRSALDRLEHGASDDPERQLLARLDDEVVAYLAARAAALAGAQPLDQVTLSMRRPFEQALHTSALLEERYQTSLRQSQARATWMLSAQRVIGLVCAVLVVLGLLAVALGVHRLIVRPIVGLQEAVRRFRIGDVAERAGGGALVETRELAERFNDMTEVIARQRRDQLTFLAAVAHDLKNPLAGLKMTVQVLEKDQSSATPERLRLLDRQLDRITRMVGDLLDSTRIEAGQLELRLQRFDLREAARAVVDLYATSTSVHRVSLQAPEQSVVILGDPQRVDQVIGNLLSNAIKYSPEGGPVEVNVALDCGEAVVSVSDHGVGIPEEELTDLFLPFHRRAVTAALAPGAGLGLSIVRRIVDAHGGRIEVRSAPAQGTTFHVHLPLEGKPGTAQAA